MQDTTRYTTSTSLHAAILSAAVTAWDKAENPDVPYGHITFRHASGSIKLLNTKERLQQFAGQMMRTKSTWALWGGGPMPAVQAKKRKTWQGSAVALCKTLFSDKDIAGTWDIAQNKLGGQVYDCGRGAFAIVAPESIEGLPEQFKSGWNLDAKRWVVYCKVTGYALGGVNARARTREQCEEWAKLTWSKATEETRSRAYPTKIIGTQRDHVGAWFAQHGATQPTPTPDEAEAQALAVDAVAEVACMAEACADAVAELAPVAPVADKTDLATLALIATGRCGGSKETQYRKAGLLKTARDGWTDITEKGERLLLANGYALGPKGWALIAPTAPATTPAEAVAALVADAVAAVAIDAAQTTARADELAEPEWSKKWAADMADTMAQIEAMKAEREEKRLKRTEAVAEVACMAEACADAMADGVACMPRAEHNGQPPSHTPTGAGFATPGNGQPSGTHAGSQPPAPRAAVGNGSPRWQAYAGDKRLTGEPLPEAPEVAEVAEAQQIEANQPDTNEPAKATEAQEVQGLPLVPHAHQEPIDIGNPTCRGKTGGQLIAGKSGKWSAIFRTDADGFPAMAYTGPDGREVALSFGSGCQRMAVLQSLAREADATHAATQPATAATPTATAADEPTHEKAATTTHTPPPSAADGQATPPVCAADAGDYTHPVETLAGDYTHPVETLQQSSSIDATTPSQPRHPRNIVPRGGLHIVEDAFEAWTYHHEKSNRFGFVMYLGKQSKPYAYYAYATEAKRDAGFERHAQQARDILASKAKRKAEDRAKLDAGHGLQVGDVVRSSWGYDQTNVDHYQIIKVIGKRTVEVRALAVHEESTGDMSGRVAPVWGEFVGEVMRRQVDKHGNVNMLSASYGRASKIEPVAVVHGVRCYAATHYSSYA